MGRPAPAWFAELVDLKFDRWYTAPALARRFKKSAADIRMVLSRRIKPVYQKINGEIFATWMGSDLIRLGGEYLNARGSRGAEESESAEDLDFQAEQRQGESA